VRFISHLELTAGVFLFSACLYANPILGPIDTFSTSTLGWDTGTRGPTQPALISGGGPGGAGDSFLQLTSDGSGSDGRLTVFNRDQWTGNFLTAAVTGIEMDLKDFGSTPLSIRVGLKSAAAQGAPGYTTTTAFSLPADGQWHHAVFLLDQADLTAVGSAPALATLLSNVAEFRILNAAAPRLTGDAVAGQLGIDNIRADASTPTPVPEPSVRMALALGAGFLLCFSRVRSTRRRAKRRISI
jgi:hypothetical protein